MQLSLIYLVAVSLAMTVVSSPVQQGKPPPLPVCQAACSKTAIQNNCGGFDTWKVAAQGPASSKKGTTVTKTLFNKKEWWFKPQGLLTAWVGGHVYDDGSMTQWVVGDANKDHAIRYRHDSNDGYYVIYWQKGQEKCYAPHETFANFDTLLTVDVLVKP